jgi:hypothetical protein
MADNKNNLTPQYDGQCAFATSLGRDAKGLDKHKLIQDSNLYLFSNPVAKLLWKIIPNRKKKADENWSHSNH